MYTRRQVLSGNITRLKLQIPEQSSARTDSQQTRTMPTTGTYVGGNMIGTQQNTAAASNTVEEYDPYPFESFGFAKFEWTVIVSGSHANFKERSMYGLKMGGIFKAYQRLLVGYHVGWNMNYGLVKGDAKGMNVEIALGPGISTPIAGLYAMLPMGVLGQFVDKVDKRTGKKKSSSEWDFMIAPTIGYKYQRALFTIGLPIYCQDKTKTAIQVGVGFTW